LRWIRHTFDREVWGTQCGLRCLKEHDRQQVFVAQEGEGAVSLGVQIESY